MTMGALFFRRFPHADNLDIKIQCDSSEWMIDVNGDLITFYFPYSNGLRGTIRRLCLKLPLLWPCNLVVWLPGVRWIGVRGYRWVARHRYLFHKNPTCETNQCVTGASSGSSKNF